MRKPEITAEPMAMAGSHARLWCSRDAVIGEAIRGTHGDGYGVPAGFGVTELQVPNGTVRLEGQGGDSG